MIALVSISFCIFLAYLVLVVCRAGILPSLSDSYYALGPRGLGNLFTVALFLMALTLMPAMIEYAGEPLRVVGFLPCAAIGFVGAAPAFKNVGQEHLVHVIGAYVAAVLSIAWTVLFTSWWPFIIPVGVVVWALAAKTETWRESRTWWLEMWAFFSTYIIVLIEAITA